MTIKDFSNSSYETMEGNHVYIPDLAGDYRSIYTGKILKVINNPNPDIATEIVNHIKLPPFCTATNNPGKNSYMSIRYNAHDTLIEVFTFEKYINSFIGHPMVRDVEYLTQEFAREITTALGHGVEIEANYELVGFKYGQDCIVRVKTTDTQAAKWREEYPSKYESFLAEQKEKKAQQKIQATIEPKAQCPVHQQKANTVATANLGTGIDLEADDTYDSQVGYYRPDPSKDAKSTLPEVDMRKIIIENSQKYITESYDDQVGYGSESDQRSKEAKEAGLLTENDK